MPSEQFDQERLDAIAKAVAKKSGQEVERVFIDEKGWICASLKHEAKIGSVSTVGTPTHLAKAYDESLSIHLNRTGSESEHSPLIKL